MEDEFSSEQRLAGHEEESLNSEGFHFYLLKSNGNMCVRVCACDLCEYIYVLYACNVCKYGVCVCRYMYARVV